MTFYHYIFLVSLQSVCVQSKEVLALQLSFQEDMCLTFISKERKKLSKYA